MSHTSPMILPEITGEIPPEWIKTRADPGFGLSKACDIRIKHDGMLAQRMEDAGSRFYLQRTDGTQGQISEADFKQIGELIIKAGESGLEPDHRALLEYVFSVTYIGPYDPEPRYIKEDY